MRFHAIFTGIIFAFIATGSNAETLPDLGGRTVIVATENAYPPMQFIHNSEPVGWEYDAMAEIARRLNFKVEYIDVGWPSVFVAVSGEDPVDIGMDVFNYSKHREGLVDFSDPYFFGGSVLLVRAGDPVFSDPQIYRAFFDHESYEPFEAGIVGVQYHTPNYYAAFHSLILYDENEERLKLYPSFDAALEALHIGEIDVTLTDKWNGAAIVAARPDRFQIVIDPNPPIDVFDPEYLGGDRFIFQKGSPLVAPINAAIAQMHSDGTFEELTINWYVTSEIGRAAQSTVHFGRGIGER